MSQKLSSKINLLFQFLVTPVVLFHIYIYYAQMNMIELDMIGMVIQSVYAIASISVTLIVCLIPGLPLRYNPDISRWWKQRQYLSLAGIILAIIMFFLAFQFQCATTVKYTLDDPIIHKETPNTDLSIIAWFLLSFFMLHFYPLTFLEWVRNKNRN